MTYTSSIHQLLSIDENLILPSVKIKEITYKQLSGILSYTPSGYEKCQMELMVV